MFIRQETIKIRAKSKWYINQKYTKMTLATSAKVIVYDTICQFSTALRHVKYELEP